MTSPVVDHDLRRARRGILALFLEHHGDQRELLLEVGFDHVRRELTEHVRLIAAGERLAVASYANEVRPGFVAIHQHVDAPPGELPLPLGSGDQAAAMERHRFGAGSAVVNVDASRLVWLRYPRPAGRAWWGRWTLADWQVTLEARRLADPAQVADGPGVAQ